MINNTILVTGGTGNQGGAVAGNLAKNGFRVKVLTRDPSTPKAQKLKQLNIELLKGDLNNLDSYRPYLKDVDGIFSVQTFENGVQKEIDQGINLALAAKEAGIHHFVYSSTAGADMDTGVPHFESKWKIENCIRDTGLPFTIIRPASLYENFLLPQVKKNLLKGKLVQPINRDTTGQYVAAEDIGKVATEAFKNPGAFTGRIVPLATEQMTPAQLAETFSRALHKPVHYQKLPALITRLFLGKSLYKMFKWLDEKDLLPVKDLPACRQEFPFLLSLEDWIKMHFPS
jgi:uncharacterized protein YbjT (DUF2867 family)